MTQIDKGLRFDELATLRVPGQRSIVLPILTAVLAAAIFAADRRQSGLPFLFFTSPSY